MVDELHAEVDVAMTDLERTRRRMSEFVRQNGGSGWVGLVCVLVLVLLVVAFFALS